MGTQPSILKSNKKSHKKLNSHVPQYFTKHKKTTIVAISFMPLTCTFVNLNIYFETK